MNIYQYIFNPFNIHKYQCNKKRRYHMKSVFLIKYVFVSDGNTHTYTKTFNF